MHAGTHAQAARTQLLTLGPTLSRARELRPSQGGDWPACFLSGPRSQWAAARPRPRLPTPRSAGADPGNGSLGAGPAATPGLGPRPRGGLRAPIPRRHLGQWPRGARRGAPGWSRLPARPAPAGPSPSPPRPQRGRARRRPERRRERLARRLSGRLSARARSRPGPAPRGARLTAGPDAGAPSRGSRADRRVHPEPRAPVPRGRRGWPRPGRSGRRGALPSPTGPQRRCRTS